MSREFTKDHKEKLSLAHKGKPSHGKLYTNEQRLEVGRIAHRKFAKTIKGKFSGYKTASKKRERLFELTFEQFKELVEGKCFYCSSKGNGIDRVDSSIGYIFTNCVSCCIMCNRMKLDFKIKDFLNQCKLIVNNKNIWEY
jgi:NOL1/NOP2/fmu family ribosome biogenesis protein